MALKEIECSEIATFIMITRKENFDLVRKVRMEPASSMEEALAIAHEKVPDQKPQFIIMPQGANTVPLFNGVPRIG